MSRNVLLPEVPITNGNLIAVQDASSRNENDSTELLMEASRPNEANQSMKRVEENNNLVGNIGPPVTHSRMGLVCKPEL